MHMDELEISGKRYISSKRIAKENRYHPDYVGQLIRGGKIIGTKVGRAWYVEEQSFADYLNGEDKAYQAPVAVPPPPREMHPIATEKKREEIIVHPTPEQHVAVRPAAPVVEPAIKKTSLTYVSDSSPLFPAVKRSSDVRPAPVYKEVYESPVVEVAAPAPREEVAMYEEVEEEQKQEVRRKIGAGAVILSLTAAAAVFFAIAFFGSVAINSTVSVEKGKPASVAYSQEKTLCFIFNTCQK